MDILLVTMQLGPAYGHGTERYVSGLAHGLRANGHRVTILAGDPGRVEPRGSLGAPRTDDSNRLLCPTGSWMAVLGRSPARIRKWLAERAPDLVHVASPAHVGAGAVAAALDLRIPVVATAVDFWWLCPRGTLLRGGAALCDGRPGWRECLRCVSADHPRGAMRGLARLPGPAGAAALPAYALASLARGADPLDLARWPRRRRMLLQLLKACDRVIFPSAATRDVLRPHLGHERWQTIPYGIDRAWFANPRPRDDPPRRPEELTIGYASSLRPHKGLHLLLEAVQQLGWSRTRIRLAGSLDDAAYWARLRRRFGSLRLDHVGRLATPEMIGFLQNVDALVVPSLWPENLPFVLLEAQACGTPVIASDVAGMAERIPLPDRLFERGSARDLARALSDFLAAPDKDVAPRVDTLEDMTTATERVYGRALAS